MSPRRAFSRSSLVVSTFAAASIAAVTQLTAGCGPGPTEAPKSPDPGINVGGVPGSTNAQFAPVTQKPEPIEPSKPRPAAPLAEEKRAVDEEPTGDPGPDPMHGSFTMAQATTGLPEKGALVATIKTSKGELRCRLFDDKAPIATANFVGLARGARPFKDKGKWVTRPAYDGTTFHRVIKGFMIQGGDPQGTGRGEPGYVFKDELWTGLGSKHDRPGLLCMANRGPDTNGMQFFITDAAAAHLDRSYTIFGECSPVSVVHAIANVPTEADRPLQDVKIEKVEVARGNGSGAGAPPPPPPPAAKTP